MARPDYAMETGPGRHALAWFQRFVWLGIVANVILTLTAMFATERVIDFVKLDPASPLVWPRFGAFGILLLTGFYLVAAIDPCRSCWASLFTVLCRFGGFFFFALVGGRYVAFGLFDLLFGSPQAIALYIAWRRTKEARENRRRGGWWVVALAILLTLAAFAWGALQFFPAPIVRQYSSDEEFFKYGSIGNDGAAGVPYRIWAVMPEVCAKHLPPGGKDYTAFGFLYESGTGGAPDQPVGFSRAKVGVERMSINCAICHSVRARANADAAPQVYLGGATGTVDIQGYQRFLSNCANDPAFARETLIPAMEKQRTLGVFERLLYEAVLIPATRKALKKQGEDYAWTLQRPRWGPGRIDPFNPVKFGMLKLTDDGTVGNSDMMPLWNVITRETRAAPTFHWDGLTNSLRESVLSSMLGDGMVAAEYRPETLNRLMGYVRSLRPPPSPHRPAAAAVDAGRKVFVDNCAECHAASGKRAASIIPSAEVGTDIQRDLMWTDAAVQTYTNYRVGYDWNFRGFRKQDGYLASTLDGLWLNGPYLHNGSVPTLRDLLKAPADRPKAYLRGGDVVDGENGGFVSPKCDPVVPPAGRENSTAATRVTANDPAGFCYDTKLIGNSNAGHLYGTDLPAEQKESLLAYLLTL